MKNLIQKYPSRVLVVSANPDSGRDPVVGDGVIGIRTGTLYRVVEIGWTYPRRMPWYKVQTPQALGSRVNTILLREHFIFPVPERNLL